MKLIKNILLSLMLLLLTIGIVSAGDFYKEYKFNYENSIPTNLFVVGGECIDISCSEINYNSQVEYYTLSSESCFSALPNAAQMASCMAPYKITGNIVPNTGIIVRFMDNFTSSSKFINDFHTNEDSYLVMGYYYYNFPLSLINSWGYAYDPNPTTITFFKQPNAIAEIQELNIKNIDDPLKPIQIEIPVTIDETVCSAFTRGQPEQDTYSPIPTGYSDYQANTKVNLVIKQTDTNTVIRNETITIPILADTCAGLSAFSWTPDPSYLNKRTTFTVTTDVIDNQASSSIQDVASVTERVYPGDLSSSCWALSYDFKLTNLPQDALNTSLAQTVVGESLYAVSKNAAFRSNAITPMQYEVVVLFDGVQKSDLTFSTPPAATEDDFALNIVNLSPTLATLPAGIYNVTLITRPVGAGCTITDEVRQYQKLIVENFSTNVVTFTLIDENGNLLSGGNVNLNLLQTRDYFIIPPVYSSSLPTNGAGQAIFTDVYAGLHKYVASYPGLFPSTRNLYVGSDMDVTVKLYATNQLPFINLPTELITYYLDPVSVNLRDYADDYNDDFDSLTFTYTLVSGTGSASWNPADDTMTFSSTVVNNAVFNVTVTDSYGASGSDLITVKFTNNHPPVITNFQAMPDNGEEPFNTIFDIAVSDLDGDALSCVLEYDDGTSSSGSCASLDEINHVYTLTGTYVAKLTVTDGIMTVIATENIFVFNRSGEAPIINSFTLSSTNGNFVPTDLTLNWNVTHSSGLATSCYLRINGVQNNVPCIGSNFINDFNRTGISRFHIIAIDSTGLQIIRSIEKTFYVNSSQLTPSNTQLVVDSVIAPGEFPFAIATQNASLAARTIEVKPIINCGDFDNTIALNNGFLMTKAVARDMGKIDVFEFITNTQNFIGKVPTDISCTFKVLVKDDLGSSFTLSKAVMFQYPQETLKYKSIRGKGTDIINYMSSTLMAGSIVRGYNTVSFTISNNEAFEKDLSISMISQTLGIENQEEFSLAPGQSREVQIPLYIDKNLRPGMYPVRYAVRDNEDKQVKYSYILVE